MCSYWSLIGTDSFNKCSSDNYHVAGPIWAWEYSKEQIDIVPIQLGFETNWEEGINK